MRIIYTPEFKSFLGCHPSIIRKFREAYKEKADFGDISITKLRDLPGNCHKTLWQAKIDEQTFFIKEGKLLYNADGYSQFINLMNLSAIKSEKVGVAKIHLGFTCSMTSFLVLNFYNLPLLKKKEDFSPSDIAAGEWKKSEHLRRALKSFANAAYERFGLTELLEDHAFHDAKHDKLIVFDPFR